MNGLYRFAGITVEIETLGPETHTLCAHYRAEGIAAFTVETGQAEIEHERIRSAREDERAGIAPRQFPEGYLETLAVCRKLAERMPEYDTVLIHGSCVSVDGAGYLFIAKSGTGKSTHARLWREMLGGRAAMVNDDKPFLRITDAGAAAYGSPWDGKHRLSANIAAPLKGLCILERSKRNVIRPVTASEAYPMLLQQVYRPTDRAAMERTLTLIDRLAVSVPLWRLGCNMELEAARVAYNAMKG